jgi:triacylglycerol lipase
MGVRPRRSAGWVAARAVLEASVGDWLHDQGLASRMDVVRNGVRIPTTRSALRRAFRRPSSRVTVWVHGLGVTERTWIFPGRVRQSFGTLLEREGGFTPVFVRYNTGRHLADSGRALDSLLTGLVEAWPVPLTELVLVGYSMGGLVVRSACDQAARRSASWLSRVRQAIYLGVPHLGAPMERAGRAVTAVLRGAPNRVLRAVGLLADQRSAGVKDLGDGMLGPGRTWLPLLPQLRHHVILGTLHRSERHLLSRLLGDGVVPIASARARVPRMAPVFPEADVTTLGGVGHRALARNGQVYAALRALLVPGSGWVEARR